jgi:hypothetical protein
MKKNIITIIFLALGTWIYAQSYVHNLSFGTEGTATSWRMSLLARLLTGSTCALNAKTP